MSSKRTISAAELALFGISLLAPVTVFAACQVSAMDTVAGLGNEVSVSDCGAGASVSVSITNPVGAVTTKNITTDALGNATMTIASNQTILAGTYSVSANGSTTSFDVLSDRPDEMESVLVTSATSIAPQGSTTVSAITRDKYGNPVAGRPMALVSSRATDDIRATAPKTDTDGRMTWLVNAGQSGEMRLSLFDVISGRQMKLSKTVAVGGSLLAANLGVGQSDDVLRADLSNGIVDHFELMLPEGGETVQANELFSLRIVARDNRNQIVRSYVGSLAVTSTDPNAELPKKGADSRNPNEGQVDMLATYQGDRTVPLSFLFRQTGTQTVAVYDKNNPTVRGELQVRVGGKGGTGQNGIQILSPVPGSKISGHRITIQGRAPSFVNLEFRGGLATVLGESDSEGVFSAELEFDPESSEVTVFVMSENGTYEATAHYFIDTIAPTIGSISIDPTEGRTDDPATITVIAEANLKTIKARINDTDSVLTADAENPAKYVGTIVAPATPGTYDVSVQAEDEVGNTSPVTVMKWNVKSKEIGKVQNVEAIGQALQVALKWDAIGGIDLAEYRIYVAKASEPTNYLYSIGTQKAVTSAIIKDLPLGETYEFSLTAVDMNGSESKEKSAPATASPLGMRIAVTPGNGSLLLEWIPIRDLPLSHYILEYGVEPGELTERRSINGSAESYMLRDLLSGVEYFIRMTPIAVNGQTRADLTVTTSGTPTGKGFIAGASEPVPVDSLPDDLHSGAPIKNYPSVPSTGVPTTLVLMMLTAALVLFGLYVRHVGSERRKAQAFLEMMQHRYHE